MDIELWSSATVDQENGVGMQVIQSGGSVILKYGEAIPGDANFNGMVDISDLYILAVHYNPNHTTHPTVDWTTADFNSDGWVDLGDLTILANHWQDGVGAPSYATAVALFGL